MIFTGHRAGEQNVSATTICSSDDGGGEPCLREDVDCFPSSATQVRRQQGDQDSLLTVWNRYGLVASKSLHRNEQVTWSTGLLGPP